jgi:hypothetical protein
MLSYEARLLYISVSKHFYHSTQGVERDGRHTQHSKCRSRRVSRMNNLQKAYNVKPPALISLQGRIGLFSSSSTTHHSAFFALSIWPLNSCARASVYHASESSLPLPSLVSVLRSMYARSLLASLFTSVGVGSRLLDLGSSGLGGSAVEGGSCINDGRGGTGT